ncbi:MAG: hypothetical protein ACI4U3_10950 [Traorella sp.]
MNKGLLTLAVGLGLGILIGYNNEEEIDDLCHRSRRMKKNVKRQFQNMQDYLE